MYIVIQAVNLFFNFLYTMIMARVLISWLPGINRYSKWVRFVDSFTDPIMEPIQKLTFRYLNLGMIDISPIVAIFLLSFLRRVCFYLLVLFL